MSSSQEPLPFVSVIVPMRNEERHVGECLGCLVGQDYPPDRFEVLVVDGRSSDRSREVVEPFLRNGAVDVRLLDNPHRTTARGLNIGIGAARGEVVARVDAHAAPDAGFLSESVAALRDSAADAVGGPIRTVGQGLVGEAIALALSFPFGVGNAAFRYSEREQYTDTVAFPAYRREVFERVGLFEDIPAGEDDEFHLRLGEHGGRLLLTPRISTVYHPRSSLVGLARQYLAYGRAKARVLSLHPGSTRLRQLAPPAFVGTLGLTGLLALRRGAFVRPFLAVAGAYAVASLAASLALARRRGWRYLPLLPLVFACLHITYGLGFLVGMGEVARRRRAVGRSRGEVSP
jgi:succinoglycan biosynthesis protein ExoA